MTVSQQQEPVPGQRPFVAFVVRAWGWIARPHPSLTSVGARRQAQLLMGLALAISATDSMGIAASLGVPGTELSTLILGTLTVICLISFVLGRTRYYRLGTVLLPVSLSLSAYALVFVGSDDPSTSLYSSIPAALVMSSALLPLVGQVILVLANVFATAMLPFVLTNAEMSMSTSGRDAGIFLSVGVLLMVITVYRDALERTRLGELRSANRELNDARLMLEERVAGRTRDLARRARYLEATAMVARDASLELDVQDLLSRAVTSISHQFGFYHTGIFLLDPEDTWLVLQAASSEGGQRMLTRGHRLRIGEGIVGYAAQERRYRLALDVGEDAVFFDNPDLPETRSELGLPLQARGEVIGVLDVQSTEPQAFSDEDVAALEALADQVAVALSNAQLFSEAQQSLESERRAYGELGREEWRRLLRGQRDLTHRWTASRRVQAASPLAGSEEGARPGDPGDGGDLSALSLPVSYLGHRLGTIVAHKPEGGGEWTPQETELMETLAGQLTLALDSARLYEETQRRAAQERLMGEITARMRETLDMDTVLRTAIREIGEALDLAEVEVRLGGAARAPVPPSATGGNGGGRGAEGGAA
jgi:GAF domain-containing protein